MHACRCSHISTYSQEISALYLLDGSAIYIAPLRRGIRVALPENIDRRYYLDSWPWYIDTMAE